ncbi:2-dehydro-3-deoxygalactonokinase [Adhaeribacter aerolatus]|uniref:2-dehydro-3-deoxygalactonokinase n=1 Tax=Adhaeribacter aerolatus TaxID=670289 RepID=A0A512B2T9_9BACT|nr:2-dehydro-3-deoxygalactonokinase [Adhaeribacter aerolatus]GEO06087.1 2-dehydro-3-deoxygalactonokinase [Adhaeribacter aerolatus]
MAYFLSCDWGTSAFRLRLVNTNHLKVDAEETSDKGIAATFQKWRETQNPDRTAFYLSIIAEHIQKLEKRLSLNLENVPVLISGMASSSIGMLELPYQDLPFALDGSDIKAEIIKANASFPHVVVLISGVKSEHDVMRGEETQLIGLVPEQPGGGQEQVFIFPGTHSKHISIKNNRAVAFKTYMTGEFFALLSQKSILSATVEPTNNFDEPALQNSFIRGVQAAGSVNLLHAAFRVRTNNLFGKFTPPENFNYLSGLLIGTELQDLLQNKNIPISLVAGQQLQRYYTTALQALGLTNQVQTFPAQVVDEAVVHGQYKIYQRLTNL